MSTSVDESNYLVQVNITAQKAGKHS